MNDMHEEFFEQGLCDWCGEAPWVGANDDGEMLCEDCMFEWVVEKDEIPFS